MLAYKVRNATDFYTLVRDLENSQHTELISVDISGPKWQQCDNNVTNKKLVKMITIQMMAKLSGFAYLVNMESLRTLLIHTISSPTFLEICAV